STQCGGDLKPNRALLDYHDSAGSVWTLDVETAMNNRKQNSATGAPFQPFLAWKPRQCLSFALKC
ncbi:MAG: hypothetical protein KAY04_03590, partial [Burkholderiales bacterium]|nr:hypothetical protein [Burkholderiales bacterium]